MAQKQNKCTLMVHSRSVFGAQAPDTALSAARVELAAGNPFVTTKDSCDAATAALSCHNFLLVNIPHPIGCHGITADRLAPGEANQEADGQGCGNHQNYKKYLEQKIFQSTQPSAFQPGLVTNEDLFDILDHVPTGMAILSSDAELRVLYSNHEFTRAFGYLKQELKTASDWMELAYANADLRQQKLTSWFGEVQRARVDKYSIPHRQAQVRCKDGSHREVILQTSLQRDLLLVTFTDITELRRLEGELLEHEKKFRGFVENANDIIYTVDLQGYVTYLSPNYQNILGVDPAEIVGKHFAEVLHPSDLPDGAAAFESVLQGQRVTGVEYRIRQADGEWSWQASNLGPMFDAAGNLSAVIGVGRDINLRKQAQEQLSLSEARYRLLSDNARDVIWTLAPDGRITYVSPSVEQVRGYTPQEAMQQSLEQILCPASIAINLAYFNQMLADVAAGRQPQTFRGQMEYLCKDGSSYWCDVMATPILAEDGSLLELLGVSRDISEHKRFENELKQAKAATEALNRALAAANEQLSRMASTDRLTGLWNRRHFEEAVTHEMIKADRYQHPLSMLIFDIDHFKAVNDRYGHLAGDRVLVELSQIARQQTRDSDLLARWGGEEFVILMPETGPNDATTVAEKIRTTFASHRFPDLGTVTASFGIAAFRFSESLDRWISRADGALYEAKQAGRNRVQLASV